MNLTTGTHRALPFALLCMFFLSGAATADLPKPIEANVKQSLEAKLLSGMRISSLKLSEKRADINGVALSNTQVSNFLRALTNSPAYTKVELVSIEQQNNRIHFYIVADVQCSTTNNSENLCDKSAVKSSSVYKCATGGKTVFQDRPCSKG